MGIINREEHDQIASLYISETQKNYNLLVIFSPKYFLIMFSLKLRFQLISFPTFRSSLIWVSVVCLSLFGRQLNMDAQLHSGTRSLLFGLSIHLYSCIVCVHAGKALTRQRRCAIIS